jgi:hypothetical protein
MVYLAESGLWLRRSATYGKRELKAFADSFDHILTKATRPPSPTASAWPPVASK